MVTKRKLPAARPSADNFNHRRPGRLIACLLACFSFGVLLAGCRYDGGNDADSISLNAGSAIATNKAIQTVDPWPPSAFEGRQLTNGEHVARAYRRYEGSGTAAKSSAKPKAKAK